MISIDALPDDVLLPIFDFYLHEDLGPNESTRAWQSLVHVCRRWRSVVFGSPRRLELRLFCTNTTRSRDMLDIWPTLPLIIEGDRFYSTRCVDNIVAALEYSDRVCEIDLQNFGTFDLERFLAAMQQPFRELTYLGLGRDRGIDDIHETVVVPDSFLGGFAPRLEDLWLDWIPFPGLPKLLLSATHLVDLRLDQIPHSGYFSPDAMVAALSALTSIEYLTLTFESPESSPDLETRRLPPSTRSVLPVLTSFQFKGGSEYLEDLVTDIDAPRLKTLEIVFFNDIIFDTPQMIRFIGRTRISSALKNAHITLRDGVARVTFRSQIYGHVELKVEISCEGLDWQLSSLEQVCNSCSPFLPTLEDLYINEYYPRSEPDWEDDIGNNGLWLELFRPFTAVQNFYISKIIGLRIGLAFRELVEGRAIEVLPALKNIFLGGVVPLGREQGGIGQFVAARRVSNHPVTISCWINSEER